MAEPLVAQRYPFELELEPGEYFWCACGRSEDQPWCDGSHEGTGFQPKSFTLTEKTRVWMCACKHSGKAPFCDGTHKKL